MAGNEQHKMGMMGMMMGKAIDATGDVVPMHHMGMMHNGALEANDVIPMHHMGMMHNGALEGEEVAKHHKKAHMGKKAHKAKKKAHMGKKNAHMGLMKGVMGAKKKAHMASKKKAHMASKKKAHMGMKKLDAAIAEGLRGRTSHKNPAKYVRSLGHNIVTSLVGQTTTTLTVTTSAHAADQTDFLAVIPFMAYVGPNTGNFTCADSLGNTYTLVSQVSFNSGYVICLFYAAGIHSIAKNAIITVTHPASTRRIIMGDEFKNIETTGAADQTAAAHNTVAATFATSGMTGVLAQDKELIYGVIGVNGPSTDSFKRPTNWTLLHDQGTNASDSNDIRLITQFRTTGTAGTYEVSGTLGTARLWGSVTQTFKSQGGASDVSKD